MLDQATELRKLTVHQGRDATRQQPCAARLLVVAGGKGGVGSTTIAVNLATALAAENQKVLLFEVNACQTDIITLCGLDENDSQTKDTLSSGDLSSQPYQGPYGFSVLPAIRNPTDPIHTQPAGPSHHLLQQLRQQQNQYDILIADVGNRTHGVASRLWNSADDLLLVTTPDPIAIMNSYATLKTQSTQDASSQVHCVVNDIESKAFGIDVHRRLDQACRRFLGFSVLHLGSLPHDSGLKEAARQATPLVTLAPQTAAAQAFTAMARKYSEQRSTTQQPGLDHP